MTEEGMREFAVMKMMPNKQRKLRNEATEQLQHFCTEFSGIPFQVDFCRPTVGQEYRSIRASLQEVRIVDTKRTKCMMMMRSFNTYHGHDFEGL